jgi:hypothetical protein
VTSGAGGGGMVQDGGTARWTGSELDPNPLRSARFATVRRRPRAEQWPCDLLGWTQANGGGRPRHPCQGGVAVRIPSSARIGRLPPRFSSSSGSRISVLWFGLTQFLDPMNASWMFG